jgi:hypothetical protein
MLTLAAGDQFEICVPPFGSISTLSDGQGHFQRVSGWEVEHRCLTGWPNLQLHLIFW